MKCEMFLHDNSNLFKELIIEASEGMHKNRAYLFKDYFAVAFLKEVFQANPDFVFKGGTCLSKCYKAIERFSEDVDLGTSFEHATESVRKKMKGAVIASAEALSLQITNLDATRSRREFNRFEIALPNIFTKNKDLLLVETAVMTPSAPSQLMQIQSFIGEHCQAKGRSSIIEEYALEPFPVMASSLERTFCDKVFAICDYYLSGDIPQRQSRHIYDLCKLTGVVSFNNELASLFSLVRQQRLGLHRCLSADANVDIPRVLHTLVKEASYKDDYNKLTVPLLYEDMSYETAAKALLEVADFIQNS